MDHGNGEGTKSIGEIVMLGDSARDEKLQEVLKEVLGEQFETLAMAVKSDEDDTYDPYYIAAAGAALLQYFAMV